MNALPVPPALETASVAVPPPAVNRYLRHDGTDAGATLRASLEITGICVVAIAVILFLYYAGLRLLVALFPPHSETEAAGKG